MRTSIRTRNLRPEPSTRCLLPGTVLRRAVGTAIAASLLAVTSQALEDAELVAVSTETGQETVVVRGTLDRAPALLLESGILVDRCGSLYQWRAGGEFVPMEQAFQGVLQGLTSRPLEYKGKFFAIFDDGLPRTLHLDERPGLYDNFTAGSRAFPVPGWPQDTRVVAAVSERNDVWVIDTSGSLFWAERGDVTDRRRESDRFTLHPVGKSGAWVGTVAAALHLEGAAAGTDYDLYTIDSQGRAFRARLGHMGRSSSAIRPDATLVPTRIGTRAYPGTTRFLIGDREVAYRLDDEQRLFRFDITTGDEDPVAVLSGLRDPDALILRDYEDRFGDLYQVLYARTVGESSADPCDRPQTQAEESPAVTAWKELEDVYSQHESDCEEHLEKAYEERGRVSIDALLNTDAILANLRGFEAKHVEPVMTAVKVYVEAHGGDSPSGYSGRYNVSILSQAERYAEHFDAITSTYAHRLSIETESRMSSARRVVKEMDLDASKRLLAEARVFAIAALEYDPDSQPSSALLQEIDRVTGSLEASIAKAIQEQGWPESYKRFAGPGEIDELEAKALEFANRTEGASYFAAYLSSDWLPNQTNVLGETLNYMLNLKMVREDPDHPDLAIIDHVALVTVEAHLSSPYRRAFVDTVGRVEKSKGPRPGRAGKEGSGKAPSGTGTVKGGMTTGGENEGSPWGARFLCLLLFAGAAILWKKRSLLPRGWRPAEASPSKP